MRNFSPVGSRHLFEPGDKVLLQKTEDRISREPTRRQVDWTLGHTPHHPNCGKGGRNKTLDSSHQDKESTRGTMDRQTSRRPERSSLRNNDLCSLHYVLFNPLFGQLIPFKWDENIWVYLAKHFLNISDFCLAGGIYVEQTFTSCLIGVCTPLESLRNYTVFEHIKKKMTYSDIYSYHKGQGNVFIESR